MLAGARIGALPRAELGLVVAWLSLIQLLLRCKVVKTRPGTTGRLSRREYARAQGAGGEGGSDEKRLTSSPEGRSRAAGAPLLCSRNRRLGQKICVGGGKCQTRRVLRGDAELGLLGGDALRDTAASHSAFGLVGGVLAVMMLVFCGSSLVSRAFLGCTDQLARGGGRRRPEQKCGEHEAHRLHRSESTHLLPMAIRAVRRLGGNLGRLRESSPRESAHIHEYDAVP